MLFNQINYMDWRRKATYILAKIGNKNLLLPSLNRLSRFNVQHLIIVVKLVQDAGQLNIGIKFFLELLPKLFIIIISFSTSMLSIKLFKTPKILTYNLI